MELAKGLSLLLPELTVSAGIILVLLLDVVVRKEKWIVALLSLFFLIGTAILTYLRLNLSGEAFGMVMVSPLSRTFDIVILLGAALTTLIAWDRKGEHHFLILSAVLGGMILVKSINFISFLLALELFSFAVIGQIALSEGKLGVEAAIKYFILSVLASTLIVMGAAILYVIYGSFYFPIAYLSDVFELKSLSNSLLFILGFVLILAGMGFKLSAVPFHFWTPEVFRGAHSAVAGFIATVSKAAAFGVLINLLFIAFGRQIALWSEFLLWLGAFTMIVGNLAALGERDIKRMLGYSTIAHAGYILLAFGVGTGSSVASALFYLFIYTIMTLGAFAVVHAVGEDRTDLNYYKGLLKTNPFHAALLVIFLVSLAGIPPTAGFVGKFYLFSSVLKAGEVGFVVWALINGVISAYYYMRPVFYALGFEPEHKFEAKLKPALFLAMVVGLVGVLYFGIAPSGLLEFVRSVVMP
ncbi:MAG: NADH-quinone oxidoreductase subunit N [Thermotogae bacterium]|nr:NADH-quinone oxidoreductase subunit N [Thermotogota bacterium]